MGIEFNSSNRRDADLFRSLNLLPNRNLGAYVHWVKQVFAKVNNIEIDFSDPNFLRRTLTAYFQYHGYQQNSFNDLELSNLSKVINTLILQNRDRI